jgi:hypothetical protein
MGSQNPSRGSDTPNLSARERVVKNYDVRRYIVKRLLERHETWALYGGLVGITFTLIALMTGYTLFKWLALVTDVLVVFKFLEHLPSRTLHAKLVLDEDIAIEQARAPDFEIADSDRHAAIVAKIANHNWHAVWIDGDEYNNKKIEQVQMLSLHLRTALTLKLDEHKDFRNEPKVALATEPDWTGKSGDSLPRLERTDYYTSFLTNQLYRFNMVYSFKTGPSSKPTESALDIIPTALRSESLNDSFLANNIGVTVLVLDADGQVLLAKQNALAQVDTSVGRFVPIGNGSLDPRDIRPEPNFNMSQATVDLDATFNAGACREFCEEGLTSNPHDTLAEVTKNSRFLGYWKWKSHGYKPEFCYVSRTSKIRKDFTPARNELDMQLAEVQIKTRVHSLADVTRLCDELDERALECAIPLRAAISLLRNAANFTHPCHQGLVESWNLTSSPEYFDTATGIARAT